MIVNLPSRFTWTETCLRDVSSFPRETLDEFELLINRYLSGERLSSKDFKTFKIDGKNKILEFKVKDRSGNWRAIAVYLRTRLVLIYAFHKKTQQLSEHDKNSIRRRIRRLE